MSGTFNDIQWEELQKYRRNQSVLDIMHGYAIIKERLDTLWDKYRSNTPLSELFGELAYLSAAVQHVAEQLNVTPLQVTDEESRSAEKLRGNELYQTLQFIRTMMDQYSKSVPSIQIGQPRYSFEYGNEFLKRIDEVLQRNG